MVATSTGASISWSIAAAIRRLLALVLCTSTTLLSWWAYSSERRGASSTAAALGSLSADPPGSLATSSDCTTSRVGASTGSTS